jgi:copper chaperone CopZ
METKKVKIEKISCGHCVNTITNELMDLDGMKNVQVNKDTKEVNLAWDKPLDWNQIEATLREINFPPQEL